LGRAGIAEMVERCCAIAAHLGETLGELEGIALIAPVTLNQFMLRFGGSDELTLAVVAAVQEDAVAFIGASQWRGEWVMRVSVSSIETSLADAELTIESVQRSWQAVQAGRALQSA
jgi:glutamate/tyrosine decarboxylase-like PLP-dependent enzyme